MVMPNKATQAERFSLPLHSSVSCGLVSTLYLPNKGEALKYKFLYYLSLILLFSISDNIYSQSWRFPDCNDLSVTKIEFIDTQHDTLLVSVFNECDTCYQHVYTGLMAYQNNDTLAIDKELLSRPSPPNNSELNYYLIAQKNFEVNDID